MSKIHLPTYSRAEEIANSLTHGVGIVLSIAGLGVLTAFSSLFGSAWHIVSCSIYSATQILLFTASTLYHSIPMARVKAVLRVLDHSAIFLLIAGTYTPFTLVNLRGPWGWTLFGVVWGMAILGIAMQGMLIRQKAWLTAVPYLAMGWAVVAGIRPLLTSVATGGLLLLLAGGLAYSLGTVFYAWKRVPFHHAIWHLFVLAGSILHFFAVLFYVVPLAA
ncbi:MAG: hemolysin III family protein [Anaerolineales bacterium]|nr:hemolysin III family protein [Anaerolineales bacterium]